VARPPVEKDHPVDRQLTAFWQMRPELLGKHAIQLLDSGAYLLDGREVRLTLSEGNVNDQGCSRLFAIDGPLRQPLEDYLDGTDANAEYDTIGIAGPSSLQMLPKEKRISFMDHGEAHAPLEAMLLAKEQALCRKQQADCVRDGRSVHTEDLMARYQKTIQKKLQRSSPPRPGRPPPQAPANDPQFDPGDFPLAVSPPWGLDPRSPSPLRSSISHCMGAPTGLQLPAGSCGFMGHFPSLGPSAAAPHLPAFPPQFVPQGLPGLLPTPHANLSFGSSFPGAPGSGMPGGPTMGPLCVPGMPGSGMPGSVPCNSSFPPPAVSPGTHGFGSLSAPGRLMSPPLRAPSTALMPGGFTPMASLGQRGASPMRNRNCSGVVAGGACGGGSPYAPWGTSPRAGCSPPRMPQNFARFGGG